MSGKIEQLESLYRETPEDPFVVYALAKEYEQTGQSDKSVALYQKLLAEHPDYVGTYYHFGKLLEGLRQQDRALPIYKKGLAIAKKVGDDLAYRELTSALMDLENQ
jgi:tetratricopeptide (TPR) repeat protein